MTLESIRYFAQLAVAKWDQVGKPPRDCAEDAWFVLFSLRVNLDLLPPFVRESFVEVWDAYGGGDPKLLTRSEVNAMLGALSAPALEACAVRTREFATALFEEPAIESSRAG